MRSKARNPIFILQRALQPSCSRQNKWREKPSSFTPFVDKVSKQRLLPSHIIWEVKESRKDSGKMHKRKGHKAPESYLKPVFLLVFTSKLKAIFLLFSNSTRLTILRREKKLVLLTCRSKKKENSSISSCIFISLLQNEVRRMWW